MTRRVVAVLGVSVVLLVLAGAAFGHTTKTPTLQAVVGPAYSITLKQNGKVVKTLKAGTYKFVISDKASFHGFTLEKEKGGTFEKDLSSVSYTGTKTVTVKLTKGQWKYYCPPHESEMFGYFNVT